MRARVRAGYRWWVLAGLGVVAVAGSGGALAARSGWTPIATITFGRDVSFSSGFTQVSNGALGAHGDVLVAAFDRGRPAVVERRRTRGPWGAAHVLSAVPGSQPFLALDPRGGALAVWRSGRRWFSASRPPGRSWRPAGQLPWTVPVSPVPVSVGDAVEVALSAHGVATAVARSCPAAPASGGCVVQVLRRRGDTAGWRLAGILRQPRFPAAYTPGLSVSVSPNGNVAVAMSGLSQPAYSDTAPVVEALVMPVTQRAWRTLDSESLPPGEVGVQASASVNVHAQAVFSWAPLFSETVTDSGVPVTETTTGTDNVQTRFWSGSRLTTVTPAPTTSLTNVALADDGEIGIGWYDTTGNLLASERPFGRAWTTPTIASPFDPTQEDGSLAGTIAYSATTAFLFWGVHNGPGQDTFGVAIHPRGAHRWTQDTFTVGNNGLEGNPPVLVLGRDGSAFAFSDADTPRPHQLQYQDYAPPR